MNTYINVCTIKSILVNNTVEVHTQRETFGLVQFPMQTHQPRTGQVSLVSWSETQELRRVSNWLRRLETTVVHQIGSFLLGFHVVRVSWWTRVRVLWLGHHDEPPTLSFLHSLYNVERQRGLLCILKWPTQTWVSWQLLKFGIKPPIPSLSKHKAQHLLQNELARAEPSSKALSGWARTEWPWGLSSIPDGGSHFLL